MPIYRYRCESCGHEVKKLQSVKEDPLTRCEVCGGELKKQIGMIGIKFNGSGYYVTDNNASKKSSSVAKDSKAQDTKKPSSEGKPEKKTESKKDTTTEKKAV